MTQLPTSPWNTIMACLRLESFTSNGGKTPPPSTLNCLNSMGTSKTKNSVVMTVSGGRGDAGSTRCIVHDGGVARYRMYRRSRLRAARGRRTARMAHLALPNSELLMSNFFSLVWKRVFCMQTFLKKCLYRRTCCCSVACKIGRRVCWKCCVTHCSTKHGPRCPTAICLASPPKLPSTGATRILL